MATGPQPPHPPAPPRPPGSSGNFVVIALLLVAVIILAAGIAAWMGHARYFQRR